MAATTKNPETSTSTTDRAMFDRQLEFLESEHRQRMEYARIEHESRMALIELEKSSLNPDHDRSRAAAVTSSVPPDAIVAEKTPELRPVPASFEAIRKALIDHLGTPAAAAAWLNSPHTGYPTTAMDAILEGKADLVLADLEQQWGPSPSYA